jgi:hypothetical protein
MHTTKEEWVQSALDDLKAFLKRNRAPFLAEQARAYLESRSAKTPRDKRNWGEVMRRARSMELIVSCGAAAAKSSNGSFKTLWMKAA